MLNRDPSLRHVADFTAKQREGNDEVRMSKDEGMIQMTKSKNVVVAARDSFVVRISSFIRHSSCVIRHCTP